MEATSYYKARMNYLRSKFNLDALQVEPFIGPATEHRLSELARQKDVEEQSRYQLQSFAVTYKDAPLTIYYDKSRVQKVLI